MHFALFILLAYLAVKEENWGWAVSVMVISGLLGLAALNSHLSNTQYILFPLFAGMFGISVILDSLFQGTGAPPQGRSLPVRFPDSVRGGFLGFLAGMLAGFLPGMGSSQSALLVKEFGRMEREDFLVALGGVTTTDLFFSLVALYVIDTASLNNLPLEAGLKVLDLGSPKDLALILARQHRLAVVATDILEEAVELSRRYASAQGRSGNGAGKVISRVEDGRHLTFGDNEFDAAYSVSVLEHIPEDGDTRAIQELARVVRPGGRIVLTVPYAREYGETFVRRDVYERKWRGERPMFYERHYDYVRLTERLIEPFGARLLDLQLWSERFIPFENAMSRWGPLGALFSPVEIVFSTLCLYRTNEADLEPKAAFLTLGV
jgi:SAM-dependent methyltransferase